MLTVYDKTDIYEKEIVPKLTEIKRICELNDIPFFSCVAAKNDENGTIYKYEGILTGSKQINLHDDHFEKHLCVANGFDVKTSSEIDFKDADFLEYIE